MKSILLLAAACSMPLAAQTLSIGFAGDIMLDEGVGQHIAAGADPLAHFAPALQSTDYRIGNLECPVAQGGNAIENKVFTFRAHPRALETLRGRFDALAVANNHSGDYGKQAFAETLQNLRATGLASFGGGADLRTAHAPLWINRNGLRIAVLGYDEFKPRSFEAGPHHPGVAWSEDSQVVQDIRDARRAGADAVITFMHWGWEREPEPSARQRDLARRMIDAGAAAVVGGHPHVTQGAEHYRGRPIIYSLGNFVFDGFRDAPGRRGWLLRLTLDRHGVAHWDTLAADIDDHGFPHPVAGAMTPCGRAGDAAPHLCRNP